MCWVAYKEKKGYEKNLIAENDIEVFKIGQVCDGNVIPYFRKSSGIIYGKINNKGDLTPSKETFNSIMDIREFGTLLYCDVALHSYLAEKCSIQVKTLFLEVFCVDFTHPYSKDKSVYMKCIIPKGAKYHINKSGECISDKLVVKSMECF